MKKIQIANPTKEIKNGSKKKTEGKKKVFFRKNGFRTTNIFVGKLINMFIILYKNQ